MGGKDIAHQTSTSQTGAVLAKAIELEVFVSVKDKEKISNSYSHSDQVAEIEMNHRRTGIPSQ